MTHYKYTIIISFVVIWAIPLSTFAWAPLTHMAINSDAYKQIYGGSIGENYQTFIMAGQNSDMICWFDNTKGYGLHGLSDSGRFNYAHDLFSFSNYQATFLNYENDDNSKGEPTFGKLLVEAFNETRHPERFTEKDKFYAYGWASHQFGDRQAHGTTGYVLKINEGDKDGHLAREMEIDAHLFNKYKDDADFMAQLKAVVPAKLIHEGSIRAYNILENTDKKIVDRVKGIITCPRAKLLAKKWTGFLATLYKSRLYYEIIKQRIDTFQPPSYFSDHYNVSVNDVAEFLRNPDTTIPENTLTLKDRLRNWADDFLTYAKIPPALAQAENEEENILGREVFYQFFFDLATQAEQNGALQTTEIVIDGGLPTERTEYSSDITDDALFDQVLQKIIANYQESEDEGKAAMGRYINNLINHPELNFDEALNQALNPADENPPVIAINSPQNQDYPHSTMLPIDFSITDDETGVAFNSATLNQKIVNQGQTIDLSLKPLNQYNFQVAAQDQAGNLAEETVNFQTVATIASLIDNISHYAELGLIQNRGNKGFKYNLLSKLYLADFAQKFGKEKSSRHLLNSFIKQVQNHRGRQIAPLAADLLISDAKYIIGNSQ